MHESDEFIPNDGTIWSVKRKSMGSFGAEDEKIDFLAYLAVIPLQRLFSSLSNGKKMP